MALAMEWVAKITTVGLQMVLPGIGGYYLDKWMGTSYWAVSGFVVGFVVGLWQMIRWTQPPTQAKGDQQR
jgi:F0F1-type ATP synthase assembly protein I